MRLPVVFYFVILIAVAVACGRQVTPSPGSNNNNLAGKMVINFRTTQAMDFNNVNYVIVFNTTGNGEEPYANGWGTTFKNYSFSFVVGASAGGVTTLPSLFQYYITPGAASLVQALQIPVSPSSTSLQLNTNGKNSQFTLTFDRSQFAIPSPTEPTPGPTPTPVPGPTGQGLRYWNINFITTDRNGVPLDALGFGATDTSFTFSQDTATINDQTIPPRPAGITPPSNPAAFIDGGDIQNNS
jgi:hypothetical protein